MKSYTFKKFKKQLLPYLLSFAIVLGAFSWKAPEADAIATEAVVAAIISVAIGSGLAFAVDRMTSPEVDAYWTGQAQQWLQSIGQSYSDFVDQAEQNMSAKDGKLILGGSFYQSIQNFLSWWKGENNISTAGDTSTVISSAASSITSLAGVTYPIYEWSEAGGNYVHPPEGVGFFSLTENSNPIEFNGFSISHSYTNSSGQVTYRFVSGDYSHTSKPAGGQYGLFFYSNNGVIGLALNSQYNYASIWIPDLSSYLSHSLDSSLSVSQPASYDALDLQNDESVALDVGASSEDDLETVIRAIFDGYRDNTLVVDQELTGAGEGEGTDTDGLFGILHGISGTISDVLDAVLSIPATLAATVTGFIGSIGNFLSGAYFGFSGIWHYVVTWVGSMAAGAAVIWSIWNGLPSAMVIPVFATAVIVIVVGLWRRFFE